MPRPGAPAPCARCGSLAGRLSRLMHDNVAGQLAEPDWHLLARELDAGLARLLACPGAGQAGCAAHQADRIAEVAQQQARRLETNPKAR
jgi:hypothetical protein